MYLKRNGLKKYPEESIILIPNEYTDNFKYFKYF